ncbi:MAG TPA: tetratricopeptide repeat protein [Thermoanaerobaculia bacterium]|nr:tetratricopeptide repeat protein [Thermoanaerobaculia bacterium]
MPEDAYDEALDRAIAGVGRFATRWQKETERLERALALLEEAPKGFRDPGFSDRKARGLHGWPLCEALMRKSFEARFRDPETMLILAYQAAGVAEHTSPEKYEPSPGFVFDLRARAFAELGNAYRVNDRFPEAETAFRRARAFLVQGSSGDLLLEARVLDLEASLRNDQGRLEDAIGLLDKVHGLYRDAGDNHLAGKALIGQGVNLRGAGRPQEAVGVLEQGLRLLEADRDPELASIGQQGLLDALVDAGEYNRASRLILAAGLREAFAAEPLNLLKLRWVEGKIHAGLGRLSRAERIFCAVREELLRLDRHYDAAILGLELAAVWLGQGRANEVRTLAEEMYETFLLLDVDRSAQHALYFIREACRRQQLTVPMIQGVRSFMERLTRNPELRFEPESYVG